jgi:myo-inositol-1(or 4)-monophosphatase
MSVPSSLADCGHEWQHELETARAAAHEAAGILLRHYHAGSPAWEKSRNDPVTLADIEADRAIRAHLSRVFPEDGLLSEESDDDLVRLSRQRVWLVDPMDGTREFTKRLPEFAVSIALARGGEPVVGVIVNPLADSEIWATRGGGSFRDGRRLHLRECSRLEQAHAVASRSELARGELAGRLAGLASLRAMGSIAWKLAVIASGEADFTYSLAPKNEWDICAGDLVLREAGGCYVDVAGRPRHYNQRATRIEPGMLGGSPALVDAFRAREALRPQ